METRFATEQEIADWDTHIAANPDGGNILQGKIFVEQKVRAGWTARYIFVGKRAVACIEKPVPAMGKLWYCPKGPGVSSLEDLKMLLPELTAFARANGVFSLKIEPELDYQTDMSGLSLIKTQPVQYNYATVLVDLSPNLDDIMKNLNQKGRHAIRRAERDGVTVERVPATDENCEAMYKLFQETAGGAGFTIRPSDYYKHFYQAYEANGTGQLFFTSFDGKVVAGAFAMVLGSKSIYKDGASVRERTAYGASHLLQWHVIQWAKENGSKQHDLAGCPPIDQINNPEHPFYGMGRFKTSFNKTVTQYVGTYDIPVQTLRAKLWHKLVEKIVRRYHFKKHHESYY